MDNEVGRPRDTLKYRLYKPCTSDQQSKRSCSTTKDLHSLSLLRCLPFEFQYQVRRAQLTTVPLINLRFCLRDSCGSERCHQTLTKLIRVVVNAFPSAAARSARRQTPLLGLYQPLLSIHQNQAHLPFHIDPTLLLHLVTHLLIAQVEREVPTTLRKSRKK